jgi:vesicular inhibitory amino acid transporter
LLDRHRPQARVAFGNSVWVFISIVLYFELFAIVTVYAISAGDHLHAIFPTISFNAHMIGIGIASLSAMFLLSTARKLSHLSLLGTLATFCVVGALMISFFMEGDLTDEIAPTVTPPLLPAPHHALWRSSGLFQIYGFVVFTFGGHPIIPYIYDSMQKPQEFESVVHYSFAIVLGSYVAIAAFVMDQLTLSLQQYSTAATAMTILVYLMILTAFSKIMVIMFPLVIGMEDIASATISSSTTSERSKKTISGVIKVVLVVLFVLVAIHVPSFVFFTSVVGLVCATIL